MLRTFFRRGIIVVVLSVILMAFGCTGVHKELRSYPSVKHLSVSSVVDMAGKTMRQMGYRTSNEYGNGHVFGGKQLGFRRFEMTVKVGSDAQMDKFLNVHCAVITNRVERMSILAEKGNKEVQKFHELFGELAVRSGLPVKDAPQTAPASIMSDQEPKGFE